MAFPPLGRPSGRFSGSRPYGVFVSFVDDTSQSRRTGAAGAGLSLRRGSTATTPPARGMSERYGALIPRTAGGRGRGGRRALHLDQGLRVPQSRDADARHGGVVAADEALPHPADLGGVRAVVVHVDDVDGQAGEVLGLAARRPERHEQVAQGQLELGDDTLTHDLPRGVERGLAGQEDGAPSPTTAWLKPLGLPSSRVDALQGHGRSSRGSLRVHPAVCRVAGSACRLLRIAGRRRRR